MTRYTVTWHPEAENELTTLWLSAEDRSEITAAVQAIDLALVSDAATKGVEIAEGLRAFLAPPLRVLFVMRDADRVVEIEFVRRI
jgi:hypothetical protein